MILFDANKCVSCNSCIRACPTPEANKAVQTEDGRTVYNIDPDKCIRCGACVKDCSHGARTYEDDTAGFWNDVKSGKQVVLLVAPSTSTMFPSARISVHGRISGISRRIPERSSSRSPARLS